MCQFEAPLSVVLNIYHAVIGFLSALLLGGNWESDECLRAFEESKVFDCYRRLTTRVAVLQKEVQSRTVTQRTCHWYRLIVFRDNACQLRIISTLFFTFLAPVTFDYINLITQFGVSKRAVDSFDNKKCEMLYYTQLYCVLF